MEDPLSRGLVLPLTRFEQVAHDRYGSGTTHALRGLHGLRETEHLMASGREDLDQLGAGEPGSARHKRSCPRVACHVASVERQQAADHRQDPYSDLYKRPHGRGVEMRRAGLGAFGVQLKAVC